MSNRPQDLISLAKHYCALIERSSTESVSWLKDIALLLPRLHAAVNSLNGRLYEGAAALTPDLDARFELFTRLAATLGDRDSYWLEFDSVHDTHAMTGSLADDLTDIYCELKHGLRSVDESPEVALQAWKDGFTHHWGQHLIDAERHLSALAAQGRLG